MLKIILIILLVPLFATASVSINADEEDCLQGHMSMDIEVEVNGEEFDLRPSCSFSYNDDIELGSGVTCEIQAGMCSSFSPERQLIVECSDGSDAEVDISCPIENIDIGIDTWACKDDLNESMDIEIELDDESFDLNYSCGARYRETIYNKSGERCKIKTNMCADGDDEGEVEVSCESGADEDEDFDCPSS